jgi:hypothetical protein
MVIFYLSGALASSLEIRGLGRHVSSLPRQDVNDVTKSNYNIGRSSLKFAWKMLTTAGNRNSVVLFDMVSIFKHLFIFFVSDPAAK